MNNSLSEVMYFKFEDDFVEKNIRCIPMIVRFKLDACGIKLKLAAWSRMSPREREYLAVSPCDTSEQIAHYRETLRQLVVERTGEEAAEIAVDENPAWSRTDAIPASVSDKLNDGPWSLSLEQWQQLGVLQRFALTKLSYPGHENKNFPKAMKEFGLLNAE
jgi:hypothetical protein